MVISKKKLNKAFELMKDCGLIARQNFYCCSNCASHSAYILATLEMARGETCLGFAYYDSQEEARRREGEDFYLGYGVAPDLDLDPVLSFESVGLLICACLRKVDISHSWAGNGNDKILIHQKSSGLHPKENPGIDPEREPGMDTAPGDWVM